MIAGRIFAFLFLWLALMAAGGEIVRSLELGTWQPIALGWLWFSIDSGSLNSSQAVVERYLHPLVWDPIVVWILKKPGWLIFAAISAVCFLVFRKRRPRRWFVRG